MSERKPFTVVVQETVFHYFDYQATSPEDAVRQHNAAQPSLADADYSESEGIDPDSLRAFYDDERSPAPGGER